MGSVLRARRFSGLFRTPFRAPSLRKLSVNSAIQHILSENTAVLPFITIHTRVFAHMVWLLIRLLAMVPLPVLHGLGRFLGRCVYALPGRYRKRLQRNALQAGYTDPGFARRAAAEAGAMILETPKVWLRSADCVKRVDAENEAVVREALDEGRGILYLTPHLGCFEITARYMVKYGPITVMYRPPRYEALEPAMEKARNISGLRAVPATTQGVREFVRALKRGEAVGMLLTRCRRAATAYGRPSSGARRSP